MKHLLHCLLLSTLIGLPIVQASAQGELQYAELGECSLQSGLVIRNCRLAYRTFGELDARKANAVLLPTWFRGTTEDLMQYVGPGKMLDTTRYFVVAVDAFGNGVSSSPSNSAAQPGAGFPRYQIRDMVRAQHQLLQERLQLGHLHAIVGLSMGGMQAFEWMVSYPEFMDKVVAIVGSPHLTSYDLLLWEAELQVIEGAEKCGCDEKEARNAVAAIHTLALSTPTHRVAETAHDDFPAFLEETNQRFQRYFPLNDYASQLRAMMDHDIAGPFGGSLAQAAAVVKAKVLIVSATQDHMVNPTPARELAGLLNASTYELESPCGHLAPVCEMDTLASVVNGFLEQ